MISIYTIYLFLPIYFRITLVACVCVCLKQTKCCANIQSNYLCIKWFSHLHVQPSVFDCSFNFDFHEESISSVWTFLQLNFDRFFSWPTINSNRVVKRSLVNLIFIIRLVRMSSRQSVIFVCHTTASSFLLPFYHLPILRLTDERFFFFFVLSHSMILIFWMTPFKEFNVSVNCFRWHWIKHKRVRKQ